MSEEISSDKVYKTRSALGDITNRPGKRGISFISSSDVKVRDGSIGLVEKKTDGLELAKKLCARMENFMKERMGRVSPHPCSEINSLKGNVISGISKIASGIKEPGLGKGMTQIGGADVITGSDVNKGDVSGEIHKGNDVNKGDVSEEIHKGKIVKEDSFISTIPAATVPCDKDFLDVSVEIHKGKGLSSVVADGNDLQEKLEGSACGNDENDLNSSKDVDVECSRFPESQESGISGLERCIGLKGDGCSNSSEGVDLIKACSCSFCTKAAYIWSDLHYQDMKGRIAALKKSQKEASILAQRSLRDNGPEKRGQGNLNRVSRLESDLTGHWTSLFLRTEDILVRECSQLEASLFTLKDLRDSCKTELELTTGVPADTE